jgi:hypothetical protein
VVLGSQFVRGREDVSYLSTALQTAALQARLAEAEAHVKNLRAEQDRHRAHSEECLRGDAPLSPPGLAACAGAFARTLWYKFVIPSEERRRERIRSDLASAGQPRAPGTSRIRDLTILFMWAPTLVLVGISMKLGKTTATLLP